MTVPAAARHRADQLRWLFAVVPPLTHLGQLILFLALMWVDPVYGWIAAMSGVALAWFGFAGWLLTSGRAWLATWMIWAEILVHSAVLHVALGPDARVVVYPWVLAAASLTLFRADEPRSRWLAFGAACAIGTLEIATSGSWTPPLQAAPQVLEALGVLNVSTGLVVAMVFVVAMVTATERAEVVAEAEHRRAESLLLDVLPAPIVARLTTDPTGIADQIEDATVVFADIAGFTPMSASRPAAEVVALLDRAFTRFDAIVAAHGLEKIKTIGDAYMAVAGVPAPHPDGPAAAAEVALALVRAVEELSKEVGVPLALRVGMHTGPVVAGVIGTRRRTYDLWGDTVNTASRMESHGEPGRVQVSAATAERLRGRHRLVARGAIAIKGKGELETWWVEHL